MPEFLDSKEFKAGSHVLMVGGELLDSPPLFPFLQKAFDNLISRMVSGTVDLLYLNTNLIYKKLDALSYLLARMEKAGVLERLKFTTSFDVDGRFTEKTRSLMLSNLAWIKRAYPHCQVVVNTILTDAACRAILSGDFSVWDFSEKHDVYVNLLPYIVLDPAMRVSHKLMMQALQRVDTEIPNYLRNYILNFNLPQDKLLYRFRPASNDFEFVSCENLPCGHAENFAMSSDKNSCFICDVLKVFEDRL